ncbi:MAG: hypothetical protein RAK25_07055, partial [TACK group archaeon]|nr:hypothetical protein [TACK group archaeon]
MDDFAEVLSSVRSRTYPYKVRPKQKRNWALYDEAQEHEYPDVLGLTRDVVDEAANSYRLVRHDATGKSGYSADDIAKMLLAQQYEGRSDRVTMGYLSLVGRYLGIHNYTGYKTLENAYSDYGVMAILNDAFFITQQPVIMAEHEFGIDGTCFSTTIKAHWESAKDQILGGKGKQFEKAVLAAGTTFKIIPAVTHSPTSNESPYLRPLFNQILYLYKMVKLMTADAGYISRENCDVIGSADAIPRIFPKKNVSYWGPWREMTYEFIYDTPKWLEQYHMRSVIETVNSTLKRTMPSPIKKKLVVRKATEIAARICVYNLRQLVYLKYTRGIDPS